MQQKELRRMSRMELIEIIYALKQNEKALQGKIDELQAKLDEKLLVIESSGSIAEASLKLNEIFAKAEQAAEQYKRSVAFKAVEEANELRRKTIEECKQMRAEFDGETAKRKANNVIDASIGGSDG